MKPVIKSKRMLFIILQIILYAVFLTLDFMGRSIRLSNYIKFCMIIVCFCYVLFSRKSMDKGILFCLRAALFFTVISDLFILILDYYIYGVSTFIIVQQLYDIRLLLIRSKIKDTTKLFFAYLLHLFIKIGVASVICILLFASGVTLDALLIITTFYFVSLLYNVWMSVITARLNPRCHGNILYAVGMILFLLCDINVGLFNLTGYIALSPTVCDIIETVSGMLMWTFYAPSQALIAISSDFTIRQTEQKYGKYLWKNMDM